MGRTAEAPPKGNSRHAVDRISSAAEFLGALVNTSFPYELADGFAASPFEDAMNLAYGHPEFPGNGSGAKLRVFFGRNIDAYDAVDARLVAFGRKPITAADRHGVGIAH